jgi:N utilization substance protein B
MRPDYKPKNNPRVIIIQKLYGKFYNKDEDLNIGKHRFKKFIKDIINGTLERNDLIIEELNKHLKDDMVLSNLDKLFQVIIKCAVFEILYKPRTSTKIIIKEYLIASNSFLEDSQTKYLNALLDKISKKIRVTNE